MHGIAPTVCTGRCMASPLQFAQSDAWHRPYSLHRATHGIAPTVCTGRCMASPLRLIAGRCMASPLRLIAGRCMASPLQFAQGDAWHRPYSLHRATHGIAPTVCTERCMASPLRIFTRRKICGGLFERVSFFQYFLRLFLPVGLIQNIRPAAHQ